jgi:hypothetical protein
MNRLKNFTKFRDVDQCHVKERLCCCSDEQRPVSIDWISVIAASALIGLIR